MDRFYGARSAGIGFGDKGSGDLTADRIGTISIGGEDIGLEGIIRLSGFLRGGIFMGVGRSLDLGKDEKKHFHRLLNEYWAVNFPSASNGNIS